MPRLSPEQRRQITALMPRYRRAVALAHRWLKANSAPDNALARRLKEPIASISRFLDPEERHAPCAGRPAMMRVMEKLEEECASIDDIARVEIDVKRDFADDGERVAHNDLLRLRTINEKLAPAQVLVYIGELCEHAAYARPARCSAMCTNVLFYMACALNAVACEDVSAALLSRTCDRLEDLERQAIDYIREAPGHFRSSRLAGYAGLCRALIGERLDDKAALQAGVSRMFESVSMLHLPEDGLWENLLEFIDRRLREGDERAAEWAKNALDVARTVPREEMSAVLVCRTFQDLAKAWSDRDRQFMETLHQISERE